MGFMNVFYKLYTHVCLTVNSSKLTMANPAFFCFYSIAIKFSEQFFYSLILKLNTDFIVPGSHFRRRLWAAWIEVKEKREIDCVAVL